MPSWFLWALVIVLMWSSIVAYFTAAIGRATRVPLPEGSAAAEDADPPLEPEPVWLGEADRPLRLLVVDDDAALRALIRTSFETSEVAVEEAESAAAAAASIAFSHPDVLVLDVGMPGVDGITFCRRLREDPQTHDISIVLLTGDADAELSGRNAGADAFLRKPFSPLALLQVVQRLGMQARSRERAMLAHEPGDNQLLLYARDFRQLIELERGQRRLLQSAYHETVLALAQALEAKDGDTTAHSERVRRYATELAGTVDGALLDEPAVEYGFVLHDVGKIAIPDSILRKSEPLTPSERRLVETHTVLGEQMVGNAALLRGHGAQVVRSHHERWDGTGYPDRLAGDEIPLPARIFSVADALDAITSNRPYRAARSWPSAVEEIVRESGTQFDPDVVAAFLDREEALRRIYYEVSTN
jgi:ribonuclease P protein subunit RPR2